MDDAGCRTPRNGVYVTSSLRLPQGTRETLDSGDKIAHDPRMHQVRDDAELEEQHEHAHHQIEVKCDKRQSEQYQDKASRNHVAARRVEAVGTEDAGFIVRLDVDGVGILEVAGCAGSDITDTLEDGVGADRCHEEQDRGPPKQETTQEEEDVLI